MFDPFEVPDAETVRLTLTGALGETVDELTTEVPIRPWGVQAYASVSGTSSDGTAAFVGLPKGRTYENPEMVIVISPTLERMIVELALGRDISDLLANTNCRIMPPPSGTTADRAAELVAATSALSYLRSTRASGTPDAKRVADRIGGLVTELIAAQNEDGGWPWVSSGMQPRVNPNQQPSLPSDRRASASALWALTLAEQAGLLPDPKVLDKSVAYLTGAMAAGTNSRDLDSRAALLHALSTRNGATFEMANSLSRERQSLSNTALAYLALTFANLNRRELAGEVLGILTPRAKTEAAGTGRPAAALLGRLEPVSRNRRDRGDHGSGRLGLCSGSAPGARARSGDRLAARPPIRSGLEPTSGQGTGPRGAGDLPRPGERSGGPLPVDRHGERHEGGRDRGRRVLGEQGNRRAPESAQGGRYQSHRPEYRRAGNVQLRGDDDRIHSRIRARSRSRESAGLGRSAILLAGPSRA